MDPQFFNENQNQTNLLPQNRIGATFDENGEVYMLVLENNLKETMVKQSQWIPMAPKKVTTSLGFRNQIEKRRLFQS